MHSDRFTTIAKFEPGTPFVEAYGLLLANLVLGRNGHPAGAVVVTASHTGSGTTTTALNLAIMMARAGQKSLLIDANLRKPELHDAFHIELAPGLVDVLGGRLPPAKAIRLTSIKNLGLLPAGKSTGSFHALFDRQQLETMITDLRGQHGFIVFDTAPIFEYPDTLNLARITDGVLLVVPERSSRRDLEEARRRLERVGAKILGAVFNRVSSPRSSVTLSP